MAFRSTVTPNLSFRVLAGNCLAMAQGIVGAPVNHPSATDAANATKYRHESRNMPDSIAVLWFDHWGSYGDHGREVYKNWGHVVIYIPDRGYASSSPVPGEVSAPYIYDTIGDVERTFACSFRFWSEDLNGKRVCQEEDEEMTDEDRKLLREVRDLLKATPKLTAREVMQYKVTRHPVADKLGTTTLAGFLAKGETLARRNISRFDQFIKLWKKQGPTG